MYILLRTHNEYDQFGDYFVEAFGELPSKKELKECLECLGEYYDKDEDLDFLLSGGGRRNGQEYWFTLKKHLPWN